MERIAALERGRREKFVVEIGPLVNFFPAEEYHQDYLCLLYTSGLEFDAAGIGFIKSEYHLLRAVAGKRAALILWLGTSANNAHHLPHSFPLICDISTRRCFVSWGTYWPMNSL